MGYYRLVQTDLEQMSAADQATLTAYAAGVNKWLSEGHTLPVEFLLLGVTPQPWTPADSLVWQKMMSWDLAGDYDLELLRAQVALALGPERAAQLLPPYPATGIDILSTAAAASPAVDQILAIDTALEMQFGRGGRESGSNDWVIAGDRTETGKPLLADDPHLATAIPAIWYLAEIQGDKIHAIGATFPGLPAIVIGHNERIAWGVTNVGPDVQDLYLERVNPANPNQVEVDGTWQDMTVVEEQIVVKGEDEPIRWAARSTRHGPLISDVSTTAAPLALRWTALDPGDTTFSAFMGINYAANWEEFTAALELFVTPSQNFVYADVDGDIGYYAPGRIPIRAAGDNGMAPVPGWDSQHEWTGWIPFAELPHAHNPAAGYVATANNRVVDDSYPYLLSNDWAPPYRAERIVALIDELSSDGRKLTLADMAAIQGDRTSTQVGQLLPFFLSVEPADDRQRHAIQQLQGWDGELGLESVAATIYEAWMIHLERALIADDLRGELYDEMANRADPLFLADLLGEPTLSAAWCEDVLAVDAQSCQDTARQALDDALDDLETRLGSDMARWQWQELHRTQYPHNPFSQVAALKGLFHRSIGTGGDRYTVNVAPVKYASLYDQTHAPGYRHIVDLANWQNSQFIITTGQSGNVLSAHYDDFIQRHRDVEYVPMAFGRENVQGETLVLAPN